MENRFEQNPPEEQGWRAYLPPQTQGNRQDHLCSWVCEKLHDLLDNDGSVRPEQAAGIYAHIAICRHCAQEFDEMQRVVKLMENVPMADMPMDYSGLIMQRIQNTASNTEVASSGYVTPTQAAVDMSARKTTGQTVTRMSQTVALQTDAPVAQTQQTQVTVTQTHQTLAQQTQSELLRRVTAGSALSSLLAYFLSSAWGRAMLNVNVVSASSWMNQIVGLLRGVPVLTWIVGLILSTLAQCNGLLSQTYHAMGMAAAFGLAFDVAICAVAYSYLMSRRREEQMRV